MTDTAPIPGRDGKKRKYNHNPLMKVGSQSINQDGSSYQVIPLAQRPLVFQPVNSPTSKARLSTQAVPVNNNVEPGAPLYWHSGPTSVSHPSHIPRGTEGEPSGKKAFTKDSFVVNTVGCGGMELGERPSAKRRRLQMESQRRIFRPSRPIKISPMVNSDIWQIIFSYCEPKLLVEAKTLSKGFCQLLNDRMGIWKQSRQNYFGRDMPDCPRDMTEQQYVDLLVRRGCQNRDCPKDNTTRVYWTFQVRLCLDCFKAKTLRADELPPHRRHLIAETNDDETAGRPLWDLLPLGRSDGRRYLQPRQVDQSTNEWATTHVLRQYVFLRSAYTQLESEYLALVHGGAQWAELKEWADNKHNRNMEYMTRAIELDSWQKSQVSLSENRLVRMRIDYFEDRAAELDPPMEEHILVRMAAYHKCLRVQAAPTERSWKTLQDKILPYRAQAEIVEKYRMDMRSLSVLVRTPAKVLHARLRDHRWDRRIDPPTQPEQDYVLRLARREFQKCIEAKVADADLLLRCLQQVFDEHAKNPNPPQGLNYNGDIGPYLLSLDDARMIVEEVIEKQIPKESVRGMAVLHSLRCRGCRRVDFVRSFSFVEAFEHILESHSIYVGKGLEFWRFAIPYGDPDRWSSLSMRDNSRFPWYTAAWPRCLPLVPGYYDISTLEDWHPSSMETLVPRSAQPSRSLFEQLTPKVMGISPGDMGSNMVHAAKILRGVRLESECQMAIMLKYAGDLHRQTGAPDPPVSVLADALEGIREANSRIDLRFRCNACLGAVIGHRSVKNTKTKLAIEKLLVHWEDKHGELGQSWMSTLMVLPTEVEVTRQVEESDRKLEAEKQAMQERNAKLANAIKKRPKLKEQVVMNARTAHEAVDELFIAVDAS